MGKPDELAKEDKMAGGEGEDSELEGHEDDGEVERRAALSA